jgi:hypothetical protein
MARRFAVCTTLWLIGFVTGPAWAQPGMAPPGGVVPAGHHVHGAPIGPVNYGGMSMPAPGQRVYQELPKQRLIYQDSPVEKVLKDVFRHGSFKLEYLLWDISDPGGNILGSRVNGPVEIVSRVADVDTTATTTVADESTLGTGILTDDLRNPYLFQGTLNPGDQTTQTLRAVTPSLSDVFTNRNNGIRGTFALPTFAGGTFEASVFALQTASADVPIRNFNQAIRDDGTLLGLDGPRVVDSQRAAEFIIIPVLQNQQPVDLNTDGAEDPNTGSPTDPLLRFNIGSFDASLKTSVWGSEASWLVDPFDPNSPLVIRPLVGFRYVNFNEDLRQRGVRRINAVVDGAGTLDDVVLNTKIDSTTINNIYGPQIGMRAELVNKHFTLGVQPKVLLGVNTYNAKVQTSGILARSPADAGAFEITEDPRSLRDRQSTFGVVGDLELFARLRVTDHFTLNAGYNFMWLGQLTRPADNIVYNVSNLSSDDGRFQNDFGLDVDFSGAVLQGVSVGGQLEY